MTFELSLWCVFILEPLYLFLVYVCVFVLKKKKLFAIGTIQKGKKNLKLSDLTYLK